MHLSIAAAGIIFPAVGLESHTVTVFDVTTGGRNTIPVCHDASGAAFNTQVAVSVTAAPVTVIVG